MSKVLKPSNPQLKFDTSSENIGCFIRDKCKAKSQQNDLNISNGSKRKRNAKNEKCEHVEFQDKAFLESVVCKILTDADCEGITQLIDSMVFPAATPPPKQNNKNNGDEQIDQEQIRQIFSNFKPFNSNHSPHHLINAQQNYPFYRANPPHPNNLGVRTQQQPQQRKAGLQLSLMNSSPSQLNPQIQSLFVPSSYGLAYYSNAGYMYPWQLPHRKKKNSLNDEICEYKIIPQKIDEDGRTTLMIRHIPNKYTQEMLYEEISRNNKMKINFLYLPMDNYNSCNVGYAFVNFIHTKFINDFYRQFNRRRWDRFNSEKICELAYARIQGTTNLIDHFHGNHIKSTNAEEKNNQGLLHGLSQVKDDSKILDFPKPDDS